MPFFTPPAESACESTGSEAHGAQAAVRSRGCIPDHVLERAAADHDDRGVPVHLAGFELGEQPSGGLLVVLAGLAARHDQGRTRELQGAAMGPRVLLNVVQQLRPELGHARLDHEQATVAARRLLAASAAHGRAVGSNAVRK